MTGDRTAKLSRDSDGEALGAAVFLTGEDLADLGVDVDTTERVLFQVEDGELHVSAGDSA